MYWNQQLWCVKNTLSKPATLDDVCYWTTHIQAEALVVIFHSAFCHLKVGIPAFWAFVLSFPAFVVAFAVFLVSSTVGLITAWNLWCYSYDSILAVPFRADDFLRVVRSFRLPDCVLILLPLSQLYMTTLKKSSDKWLFYHFLAHLVGLVRLVSMGLGVMIWQS